MKFENKIAVVTGGGGNIGKHIAMRFAKGGAKVAIVDYSEATAKAAAEEINADGGCAKAFVCDVREYASVHSCFAAIEAELGAVDILVTAAGGSTRSHMTTLAKQSPEIIEENIGVNLFGAMWFAKEMAASLEARGAREDKDCGRIIFIASILSRQGLSHAVEYSAGKAGIVAMSKALAKELGHIGATVNCVSPGKVNRPNEHGDVSNTNYLGKLCTADDIADAVEFLAAESGRFITGHDLAVDGGRSLGLKGS